MDVRLSDEQRALRDSVAQLVERLGPKSVADLDDDTRRAKLDAAIAAAGWRELRAADEDGRPWASAVEAAIVAEELGCGLADAPYLEPALAADLDRLCASESSVSEQSAYQAFGLALTCADLVGVMRGATKLAVDYAGVREQYGAHIGSFQAVQHLLADAHVAMEGSRSIALHAAWAVDALPADEALVAASTAKAYCSRAARQVCETSIQVHGGIGNTWECLAHVYLRRALVSIELFGGVGPNLERVLAGRGIGAVDGLR